MAAAALPRKNDPCIGNTAAVASYHFSRTESSPPPPPPHNPAPAAAPAITGAAASPSLPAGGGLSHECGNKINAVGPPRSPPPPPHPRQESTPFPIYKKNPPRRFAQADGNKKPLESFIEHPTKEPASSHPSSSSHFYGSALSRSFHSTATTITTIAATLQFAPEDPEISFVTAKDSNKKSSDSSSICRSCSSGGGGGTDDADECSSSSMSSSFSCSVNKPHKGNDSHWEAIQAVRSRVGSLGTDHFRLPKKLGSGDIGTVYLAELQGTGCYFAVKMMDKEVLTARKKLARAQTEKEILQCLDHPFLPTLYAHFETDRFSYLVMEFCPGGDLHSLRQRQLGKHFSEQAARFYVAEVLLALEYLHMLGIIYRDLKPENVLVRDDGHIMLSDFDLSLRCAVCPTLVKFSNMDVGSSKKSSSCVQPSCAKPTCVIKPSCIQPTCFAPPFLARRSKKDRKPKPRDETSNQVTPLHELIAEPTGARSMSFVGTHEYLAPEIIKGEGHGSAVDWWTFGIFLYELLFGRTPFKGSGNRATLFNVVGEPLKFPETPIVSFAARDLIRGLLVKEPQHRLAYRRGATEVKHHPFFQSVNWALIRCANPPEKPKPFENVLDVKSTDKYLDMNFF